MYHYSNIKSWSVPTLAGLTVGMLIMQILTPTIVHGMIETTEIEPVAEEILLAESLEVDTSGAASDTSQVANVIITEEPETVGDDDGEVAPEVPTQPDETTIETGDAVAGLTLESEANFNEVETTTNEEDGEPLDPPVLDDAQAEDKEIPKPLPEDPSLLEIQASNTATNATNATTSAETGQNTASGETVTIDTGDAVAYTDVLNVVNTNIVNSDGLVEFVNGTLGYEDFDLRDEFELTYAEFETSESTPSCTLDACADNVNTNINASNTATIDNNITVIADTGGNQAAGDKATIQTGDAYASANVINVANTNITDSNYLLLVFNNFSDYAGDIVLPNSSFFDNILQTSSGVSNVELNTNNSATINNTGTTIANTGDNTALGDNSNITTGNAGANSNTTNLVNQNLVGGSSFSMLIRVHGDWTGSITGLPDGLTWRETDQGIEIISLAGASGSPTRSLVQSTDNTAVINNNVQVFALTGDNEAAGNEATINTGNAYADSSVLNIANTNVIGSNWSNLIFTIYGNWSGNLAFGQPNLWLGVTADSPDQPIMPGSKVTYTYTVFNNGDVTASDVTLDSLFETNALVYDAADNQSTEGVNTKNTWHLGDIGAGETRELSHTTTVHTDLAGHVISAIPLTSRVSSSQNDADDSDNEDIVTIFVGEKRSHSNSQRRTFPAHFDIEKTASRDLAQPGDTVDYTVTFFNRGGQLYNALLVDILENEDGELVQQQSWPLGEIKNWETITVSYSVEFNSAMATGTYKNSAQLVGFHTSKKKKYQIPYESPIAVHTLGLGTTPAGQVLGIQDSMCPAYLTEYLRYGKNNDSDQVIRLQQFLNDHLNYGLTASGFFDLSTEQAVRDFQLKYRDDVLTPWGLERDSGYVYYTTQKKINELMCQGVSTFPLAPTQLIEIESFKNRFQQTQFGFDTTVATVPNRFGFSTSVRGQ